MNENTITVVGNITREPELKFLNSGQPALRRALQRRGRHHALRHAQQRCARRQQRTATKHRQHARTGWQRLSTSGGLARRSRDY